MSQPVKAIWKAISLSLILAAAWIMPTMLHAQVKGLGKTLPEAAEVLVCKKWLGATGDEAAVEIQLICDGLAVMPRQ